LTATSGYKVRINNMGICEKDEKFSVIISNILFDFNLIFFLKRS